MANIKLTKQQQQILALAVLGVLGGGFVYIKYFWLPIMKARTELDTKLTAVKEQIKEAKKAQAQLKDIEKALVGLEKELTVLTQRLPKDRDIPGIITKMSELTRRYGLEMTRVSVGLSTPQKDKGYFENNYTLAIRGTYHNIGRFLASLVLEERVLATKNVSFGTPDTEGKHSINLSLVAYQYAER